ncbi:uncharacterized protein LOC116844360 [Odontomachus brunneus]|uniref:uncharacterized protein LOC116844360 n=1 Tax=Odontomachus brunneus TaxID=486640 RepID=UPI0013F285E0|nr:uncharacterized protein LOC116844360 [Odontomachus brunneus]
MVLAGGRGWREALNIICLVVDQVVSFLNRVGFKVAPLKTEIMFVHDGSRGEPPRTRVRIDNISVKAGPTFGLVLDSTWGFQKNFELLIPKLGRAANMLGSLLPNLGDPKRKARWLYVGVVHSMSLYGAPVWASEMATTQRITTLGYRAQRWNLHLERVTVLSGRRVAEATGPVYRNG